MKRQNERPQPRARAMESAFATTFRLPTVAALGAALAIGSQPRTAGAVVLVPHAEDGGPVEDGAAGDADLEDAAPTYVDAASCPPELGGVQVPVQPVRGTGCGCGGGDRNESAVALLGGATLLAAVLQRRRRRCP